MSSRRSRWRDDGGGVTDLRRQRKEQVLLPTAALPEAAGTWRTAATHTECFGEFTPQTASVVHSAQEHSGCGGGDCSSGRPSISSS